MATQPSILICGASIAGPVLAIFLSKAGINATIIERSPSLRTTGQQVDIRGSGLTVIKRMGLESTIRSHTTEEAGLKFVDENNQDIAVFPVDKETGMSFSSDIEILRGELGKIFFEKSQEGKNVEYIFGDHVTAMRDEPEGKVQVELASGQKREFDLVIGADGQNSKTRRLLFPEIENPFQSLGQYIAYFTIPFKESDGTYSRWSNFPGGRTIILRPDHTVATRAFLAIIPSSSKDNLLKGYLKMNEWEQKELFRELFKDAGWESERVLRDMERCEDWYMQEIGQVKMDRWYSGRVALLGDAAYCPSPISGAGTSLAIVGAYVLAGEIVRSLRERESEEKGEEGFGFEEALEMYERKMRGFVNKAQKLPPGAPGIVNPQTKMGISILKGLLGFVYWSGLTTVFSKLTLGLNKREKEDLEEYEF